MKRNQRFTLVNLCSNLSTFAWFGHVGKLNHSSRRIKRCFSWIRSASQINLCSSLDSMFCSALTRISSNWWPEWQKSENYKIISLLLNVSQKLKLTEIFGKNGNILHRSVLLANFEMHLCSQNLVFFKTKNYEQRAPWNWANSKCFLENTRNFVLGAYKKTSRFQEQFLG